MESQFVGDAARVPSWLKRALLLFAIWCVPGLILGASMYTAGALKGDKLTLVEALLWRMPEWQVWAVATPLIVWLGRRFPLARRPWLSVPVHIGANAVIAVGDITVYWASARLVGIEPFTKMTLGELLPFMLLKSGFFEMLVYWLVIAVDYAFAYQRRYREAAARLAEAQLDALKLQLHPHFLFNTLNSISVLMRKGDGASAVRMLGGLSDLLRRSLTSLRVELVPLEEELDFIARYLDIETTRFPDRLRVTLDIDPAARRARVPTLILQPIVENAIEHGIAPTISGGRITITARVAAGTLRIEVRDDGAGLAPEAGTDDASPRGTGLGLSHVRKRLAQLYPDAHRFELSPGEPIGAIAMLEIPHDEERA